MIQRNRPKLHIFQIINAFLKNNNKSQLLVPLFLVLGAVSLGKDNGTEPISMMFNKVGEHIWRDLRPFLHAEPFKILHILRFRLWTALFNSEHMFSIGFKSGD